MRWSAREAWLQALGRDGLADTGMAWPNVDVRQARLREAIEIIRLLSEGGYQSYDGRYFTLDDARVFDLPKVLPPFVVAAGGKRAAVNAGPDMDGFLRFYREELAPLVVK